MIVVDVGAGQTDGAHVGCVGERRGQLEERDVVVDGVRVIARVDDHTRDAGALDARRICARVMTTCTTRDKRVLVCV